VAAASADGVVLSSSSLRNSSFNACNAENHPDLEDSATPPSEGGESFVAIPEFNT